MAFTISRHRRGENALLLELKENFRKASNRSGASGRPVGKGAHKVVRTMFVRTDHSRVTINLGTLGMLAPFYCSISHSAYGAYWGCWLWATSTF